MASQTILGLTSLEPHGTGIYSYDSSASLMCDGHIVGSVSEERFTRNKHHAGFPWMSLNYLFGLGYSYADIDAVAIPYPLQQKVSAPLRLAKKAYSSMFPSFNNQTHLKKPFLPIEKKKVIGIGHQRAHAASAYRTSGFKKALVISLDLGGSEEDIINTGGGIFIGENGELERLRALTASFGIFYTFVTEGLGFKAVDGEGKTMGLAPFGNEATRAYHLLKEYAPTVRGTELIKQKKDFRGGVTVLNNYQRFVFYDIGIIRSLVKRFSDKDVAAAAQRILEEGVVKLVENALDETGLDKLCLAGEVFLNVKLNQRLRELKQVKDIYVYPNPGDAGAAIGAALEAQYQLTGERANPRPDNNIYLGPSFTDEEIEAVIKKYAGKLTYRRTSDPAGDAAELITRGRIIGWFQGRMEWGPRALGARSVLSAPGDVKVKDKLNLRLKQREWFMPFAPSMLLEEAGRYLKDAAESPYMIMAYDVIPHAKEEIAATVHVDDTVRPQTVSRKQNALYYQLIREHEKMTGVPAVLNTSFNRHGLPIVCTPEDAVQHLKMKCVEELVIGNFVVGLKR